MQMKGLHYHQSTMSISCSWYSFSADVQSAIVLACLENPASSIASSLLVQLGDLTCTRRVLARTLLGACHDSSNEQGGTIHSKGGWWGAGMITIIGPWGLIILPWIVWLTTFDGGHAITTPNLSNYFILRLCIFGFFLFVFYNHK